jgi:ADP-heptose:LPS heptosyltransferase
MYWGKTKKQLNQVPADEQKYYFCLGPFIYLKLIKRKGVFLTVIFIVDILFRVFTGKAKGAPSRATYQTLAVKCPGHLGDLLICAPLLQALRTEKIFSRIIIVTGRWNFSLARLFVASGLCDDIIEYNQAALNRGSRLLIGKIFEQFRTFVTARRSLIRNKCDVYIDLRPYWPPSYLLPYFSKVERRIGFGLRGLRFTLTDVAEYNHQEPLGQSYNNIAQQFGIPATRFQGPCFPERLLEVCRREPPIPKNPFDYIVVHPFSGEKARQIDNALWINVLERLSSLDISQIVVVGSSGEKFIDEGMMSLNLRKKIKNLIGLTDVRGLILLCSQACFGVTVDSFVAHCLLASQKQVVVVDKLGDGTRRSYARKNVEFVAVKEGDIDSIAKEVEEKVRQINTPES